jgi:hypothetical protein
MIVRYKSVYKIREEDAALKRWLDKELARVERVAELADAMLSDDTAELAKAESAELAIARVDVARLRKQHKLPDQLLQGLAKGSRIAEILREYNERADALKADEERSRRFNEAWSASEFDWLAPRTIH